MMIRTTRQFFLIVVTSLATGCLGPTGDELGQLEETEAGVTFENGCWNNRAIYDHFYMAGPGPNCSQTTRAWTHYLFQSCVTQEGNMCTRVQTTWNETYWEAGCGQVNSVPEVYTETYECY